MELLHELEEIGLKPNEAKAYLTLLRIGKTKAGRLAKECMLERTSTYNALKRLIQYGLVSAIIESNKRIFYPAEPKKLVEMFYEKEERASLIIPQLIQLKKFEKEKENVLKFRGYAGIKTAFNDILKTCKKGEEYIMFGSENQLSERMPIFAEIFVARKDRKKLRSRILIRRELGGRKTKMSRYTKARYAPKEIISPSNVTVYPGKVLIVIWDETPEAVIIDNKATADTFKTYFEFMWKHAEIR